MKKRADYTGIIPAVLAPVRCLFNSCKNGTPGKEQIVRSHSARNRAIRFHSLSNSDRSGNGLPNALDYTAEIFTIKYLEAILSESKCDGIRIYHELDAGGRNTLLIVGVANNSKSLCEDLLPKPITPNPV